MRCFHRRRQAEILRAVIWSNLRREKEPGTAVGRVHQRKLIRQQESIVYLEMAVRKAPRGGLHPNRGFVELGLRKLIPRLSDFLNPVSSYQLVALWQRVHAVPDPVLRPAAF